MGKILRGTLRYKKKFYFVFDEDSNILYIDPINFNNEYMFFDDTFLKRVDISGVTSDNRYIKFLNINFIHIGNGKHKAWVPAYILGNSNLHTPCVKLNMINKFSFRGEAINLVFNYKNKIDISDDYNLYKYKLFFDYGKIESLYYKNFKLNFYSLLHQYNIDDSINRILDVNSIVEFVCDESITFNKFMEVYKDFSNLLCFATKRKSVNFDSIKLYQKRKVDFFDKNDLLQFDLYIYNNDEKYDLPTFDRTINLFDFINFIPEVMISLKKDPFFVLALPVNSEDSRYLDLDKFRALSSTFEKEFDLLFTSFKSNKDKNFDYVKKDIIKYIDNCIKDSNNNAKKRGDYKTFRNSVIKYEGALYEKCLYSLKHYSYFVDDIIAFYIQMFGIELTKEILSKEFCEKRNNISHGGILEKWSKKEIVSYKIFILVVYAIILERSNCSEDVIKNIINFLK